MKNVFVFYMLAFFSIEFCGICLSAEYELTHTGGTMDDGFGAAVSISNTSILVGAPFDDQISENAGSVYYFQHDGSSWFESQKIVHSALESEDRFGAAVAIEGDQAIIGAPGDNLHGSLSGAAYFFRFDGTSWMEDESVTDPDGQSFDQFGSSVAISDEYAFVASLYDSDQGSNAGSVFVYRNDGSGWAYSQKLEPAGPGASFGRSVSIDGGHAAIGADGDSHAGLHTGAVYLYRLEGISWVLDTLLTAGDPGVEDRFGTAASLDYPQLLVGSPHDNAQGPSSGSVYVFTCDAGTWTQKEKLVASDGAEGAQFGKTLAIKGRFAIAGSYFRDGQYHVDEGAAYLLYYDGRTWVELTKLLPQNSDEYDFFGYSVALSDVFTVIGAPTNMDLVNEPGTAYVFDDFMGYFPLPATGFPAISIAVLCIGVIIHRRNHRNRGVKFKG